MREFRALYPEEEDFVNSTVAARVNGYLGRNGTLAALQAEIDGLGLPAASREKLLELIAARKR
jgi:peptide-methionine (S)-S-oxide reductase